ncbi:unnamed protein product [Cuscuta europaea]|uniref:Uncharacterized protein n=1 Tax=Cuscuta europaea TaxID=41803 RepID=A0A9P0YQA8_CUSEU|nr:unnamed protein product [Cuscuta europaea]
MMMLPQFPRHGREDGAIDHVPSNSVITTVNWDRDVHSLDHDDVQMLGSSIFAMGGVYISYRLLLPRGRVALSSVKHCNPKWEVNFGRGVAAADLSQLHWDGGITLLVDFKSFLYFSINNNCNFFLLQWGQGQGVWSNQG